MPRPERARRSLLRHFVHVQGVQCRVRSLVAERGHEVLRRKAAVATDLCNPPHVRGSDHRVQEQRLVVLHGPQHRLLGSLPSDVLHRCMIGSVVFEVSWWRTGADTSRHVSCSRYGRLGRRVTRAVAREAARAS
eukprot:2734777-Prymnesium_polylepis.1